MSEPRKLAMANMTMRCARSRTNAVRDLIFIDRVITVFLTKLLIVIDFIYLRVFCARLFWLKVIEENA